ncbi:unnamed protein product [Sphagnum jensenii]
MYKKRSRSPKDLMMQSPRFPSFLDNSSYLPLSAPGLLQSQQPNASVHLVVCNMWSSCGVDDPTDLLEESFGLPSLAAAALFDKLLELMKLQNLC